VPAVPELEPVFVAQVALGTRVDGIDGPAIEPAAFPLEEEILPAEWVERRMMLEVVAVPELELVEDFQLGIILKTAIQFSFSVTPPVAGRKAAAGHEP